MFTQNLGYPRIGGNRELKKAVEAYWSKKISQSDLQQAAQQIRLHNWQLQKDAGIDLIPSNDFSLYDQMLDMCLTVSAIPHRFHPLIEDKKLSETDLYFAMARGFQSDGFDITAMEMTKWFDTNYHYIVPEFYENQSFNFLSNKIVNDYKEAKQAGIETKPVIIGALTFLLLGKEKETEFNRLDLLKNLLPVYKEILKQLSDLNVQYVQFDEPILATNLSNTELTALSAIYTELKSAFPNIKFVLANYFECYGENLSTVLGLPFDIIHLDLVRCPSQLDDIIASEKVSSQTIFSLGVIDGRNIWKNDYEKSLAIINKAINHFGKERLMLAPSCSLLHTPCDLDSEKKLDDELKNWLSFAKQKINELAELSKIVDNAPEANELLEKNKAAIASRKNSTRIHKGAVKNRVKNITDKDAERQSIFAERQAKQHALFNLPLFPTTTIGSFPQTTDVRKLRAQLKKGEISETEYTQALQAATIETIRLQEELDIDVLVHGEFERNDMVEYFGENIDGYAFSNFGWVQSYGSRCVKPPIIYGDIERKNPITVEWSSFAQSQTKRLMKGMLTGPITMLQWSFVRDDQPRSETAFQLAWAIRDEVVDLEKAGIKIIQIDEPAIREGLPLRKENWQTYLAWAVKAFKIAASGVQDETQIHTHMCYSEFNDIIQSIADMDADVITIETSRSQMELLDAFVQFNYPNEIGPGVYDIHSPRVPTVEEMEALLEKALAVIPAKNLWVNPDCGLKTRGWNETKKALENMVNAAKQLRVKIEVEA
ncbi:5-methyltetrahydropteroyltriglutamate--homocysteine S-methyltransferase [Arachidicoccus ginsenosidimutans]|uniref:5-methyltetrahydropteroyltriglutamate-- homocysteine S-methyltransferase n=1 Tax=Arachidicoccus sp. BS20 TaxID=1850526 RepID=UPI0007F16FB3|nr:5-methyltetrahydropteroyltriglutamate--homocysteine S-methyltransferase [Arachidicoccus sp. BS20]ANI89555.1 5-methyltetrahydropteroyltriglutamate--homocysteine S-methyltransferase [Arachidicoccus sp. BS20]